MRKIILLSLLTFIYISNLISQAPNLMSYQAVIWDASGSLVSEKMVSIKLSILQGSVSGTSVYSENHRVQSNVNGLVSLMIGGGTNSSGKISDINWGGGSFFLKTETDPAGASNYIITGTTQLVSVPYALHSNTSNNLVTPKPGLPGQILTVDKDGKPIWVSTLPTVNSTNSSNITPNTAASGGNVISDGGSPVTARGIVWSTFPNPTVSLSTITNNGSGLGLFSSSISGLILNTTYYVRAYATNNVGTGYGNEISFTTKADSTNVMGIACPGTPTVKDIDGNTYNTVQIGTQCWTKENLKVTKYNDGTTIPLDTSGGTNGNGTGETWSTRSTGARTIHSNDNINLTTYGYLYNWYAVKGIVTEGSTSYKNLCPSGWHIPSDAEWTTLTNYLGGESDAGGKMKSVGTAYWHFPNGEASNESGFSALPGGSRNNDGGFFNIRTNAYFWSATENDNILAWSRNLWFGNGNVSKYNFNNLPGVSVRCLRDSLNTNPSQKPILTTNTLTAITQTGATTGGNITSDGGSAITARGVVWSTLPTPNISLSTKTTDGTGIGSFSSSLTNLTPKTTYYVRAYASNSGNTGYGNQISFTTKADSTNVMGIPCPGTPTVKDIDGNTYNTVQIGTQCWTKENLKASKYNDGTTIPLDTSGGVNGLGQTWGTRSTGARTIYANDNTNLTTYGYLYNWYAAKGISTSGSSNYKNICPTGWHVPSDGELTTLTTYLGGESVAGGKMKTIGTAYWTSPNTAATNESGFSALPGGSRLIDGSFNNIRGYAFFWSATENDDYFAWGRYLYNNYSFVNSSTNCKSVGASVRCLRD
jgi:uncharacterized protein (TIGR02145 family)